jgi:hypothetical protein
MLAERNVFSAPPAPAPRETGRPARDIAGIAPERVVLLFGLPRSGTTWLAKVFDSHPDVLYRHEPDTVRRGDHLPDWPDEFPDPTALAGARAYLDLLFTARTLKTSGSRPLFRKSYHGPLAHALRVSLIHGLRAADGISRGRFPARALPVPDLIGGKDLARITLVLKSVSSPSRLGLFAQALPGCRVIYMLRHPCAQVASMRRGEKLGLFEEEFDFVWLLQSAEARRHGLTEAGFARLPLLERLAWQWVILNERALADIAHLPATRVVRHADLARAPLAGARELLAFAGLSLPRQSEDFIGRSTRHKGAVGYYQVFRDAAAEIDKWRGEMAAAEQAQIWAVVRNSALAAWWPEERV